MRRSKKWMALLLTAALTAGMAAGVTGCGESSGSGKTSGSESTGSTEAGTESGIESGSEAAGGSSAQSTDGDLYIDRSSTMSQTSKGLKVKVNYSAYQKNETKQANYTRISDETITELKASDSYGTVYPFIGDVLYYSDDDGYSGIGGYLYGIADEAGEIICDPVFQDMYIPSYVDEETGEEKFAPYYVLLRYDVTKYSDEEYDYSYDQKCTIVSFDGSYVSDGVYSGVQAWPGGLILEQQKDDQIDYTIVDNSGKTLLEEKDIQLGSGSHNIDYFEWARSGELFNVTYDDYSSAAYIDLTGKMVTGPYSSANYFTEGLADVRLDENGTSAMIDTSGNYVVKPGIYESLYAEDGYIIADNYDYSEICLLDQEGNEIVKVSNAGTGNISGGYFTVSNYDGDKVWLYDLTGKLLDTLNSEKQNVVSDLPIRYDADYSKGTTTITNMQTGAEVTVDDAGAVVSSMHIYTDDFEDFQTDPSILEVCSIKPGTDEEDYIYQYTYYDPDTLQPVISDGNYAEYFTDYTSGERILIEIIGSKYKRLDDSYQTVCTYTGAPKFYNGTVVFTDDMGTTILDKDGNEIFYYPLTKDYAD